MSNGGVVKDEALESAEFRTPRYADEEAEALGEKLAQLYERRAKNPRAKIDDVIESTRRELRRGPRLRAGEFLSDGRYRLIERLGDSAGDATWFAWDRETGGARVIREMVGPWVAKKMRVGSFLESARTLQQLEHPGLAGVHEARQSRDGFVYLVTDHLTGGQLPEFEGDSTDVLQTFVEVARALQAAHDAGLRHAQIRPEAVHFDEDGNARITDFDLAGETVNGDSGSVYVAPEMVERGATATPTADVYSLAMITLYALNGGSLPYTVVRGPERFIDKLNIPETAKNVLKKAVDWEVEGRYASTSDAVADLLADDGILAELAERALSKKRYSFASVHYTALWSLRPDDSVEIKHTLGQIYLEMEAWEEAYSCLSSSLEETKEPDLLFDDLRRFATGTGDWKRVADLLWNQARNRPPVPRASMRAELAWVTEAHLNDALGASEVWTLVLQDHRTPARGEQALRALRRLAEEREDWSAFIETSEELLPFATTEERPSVEYQIGRAWISHLDDVDAGLVWIDRAEAKGVEPLDMASRLQEIRAERGQWRRLIGLMRLQADHEKKVRPASKILLRAATIARAVHLEAEAEAIYENLLERAPQHYPALRELARMRHRTGREEDALRAYKALTTHYDGKSEEPEASERAADHAAYGQLLIQHDELDAGFEQVELALALQSDNIEALRLMGPLYLDHGRLEEGSVRLERLHTLFKAVQTKGARLEAAIQRADAAWYRGRLAVAMRWYNSVLTTAPDHPGAWWGLAKIALAAHGGHPGTDRAPWLSATPEGFAPPEGLARLFMGLMDGDTLKQWLQTHALGAAIVKAGASTPRMACAVVDLMARFDMIDAALFERLRVAYPDWQHRIDDVENLYKQQNDGFRFERSYRWSRAALDADFDLSVARRQVGVDATASGILPGELPSDERWRALLGGAQPAEPPFEPPDTRGSDSDSESLSTVEFLRDDEIVFALYPDVDLVTLGASEESDWIFAEFESHHARLRRIGLAIYIEAIDEAPLGVDDQTVPGWRLVGGETVALGDSVWTVRLREDDRRAAAPPLDDDSARVDLDDGEVTQHNLPHRTLDELQAEAAREAEEVAAGQSPPGTEVIETTDVAQPVSEENAAADDDADETFSDQTMSRAEAELDADETGDATLPDLGIDEKVPMEPSEPTFFMQEGPQPDEDSIPEPVALQATFDDEATQEIRPSAPMDDLFDVADIQEIQLSPDEPSELEAAPLEVIHSDLDAPVLDSLGPAGDAPTPGWLAGPGDDALIETAKMPTLRREPEPPPEEAVIEPVVEPESVVEEEEDGPPPAPAQPVAKPVRLGAVEVMSGPARGSSFSLESVLTLGTSDGSDIHLPTDPMLSDVHCRFVSTETGFLVMDNGSERGTMVDGTRVSEVVLRGGETIMVGSTVLRFVLRD